MLPETFTLSVTFLSAVKVIVAVVVIDVSGAAASVPDVVVVSSNQDKVKTFNRQC